MSQQRRVACELLILGLLSTAFLVLVPRRPIYVDVGLGLLGLSLVLLNATYTRTQVWGQWSLEVERAGWQHCVRVTMLLTIVAILVFLLMGVAIGYQGAGWPGVAARILHPKIPFAILLYLPWTLIQQTLFQFYLLGRLRMLCPVRHPLVPSALSGLIFGAVHVSDIGVASLTALGGTVWSYLYLRYRLLWPLAVSHALVGTTFYYWVYGYDLASRWSSFLAGLLYGR
ncbi:MAG: hypothetical protein EWM72_00009 [Nitrospira sp.]|nr:MAG: hypothetical protein EWM72_00009 [Nitrospira sp.]